MQKITYHLWFYKEAKEAIVQVFFCKSGLASCGSLLSSLTIQLKAVEKWTEKQ